MGQLRLRIVEFIHLLVKLNAPTLFKSLAATPAFEKVAELMANYPWNNFLQLKAIAIFEEVFESADSAFKSSALRSSRIAETLVQLSENTSFNHPSNRQIR